MKRKFVFSVLSFFLMFFLVENVNSQSTCQGIYHDGVASNSWFGDSWDDLWNLDWKSEKKECFSQITINASISVTTVSVDMIAQAASEIAGCGGGDGSCCEQLCNSGAGW